MKATHSPDYPGDSCGKCCARDDSECAVRGLQHRCLLVNMESSVQNVCKALAWNEKLQCRVCKLTENQRKNLQWEHGFTNKFLLETSN